MQGWASKEKESLVRSMRRIGRAEEAHDVSVHEVIRIRDKMRCVDPLKARFPRGPVEGLKLMI